jgi:hypothetical protein
MNPAVPDQILAELRTALFRGEKIRAIKICREATGLGLKEAKDMIEALEADLRAKEPESFMAGPTPPRAGCIGILVFIAALIVMAGLVWGMLARR